MIPSLDRAGRQVHRGIQHELRSFSGASAARVIEAADTVVPEHHHDWPVLTLFVMGDATRIDDAGKTRLNRPCIALHAAGEPHANIVNASGLEQIDVQFDPAWLRPFDGPRGISRGGVWMGGEIAARARELGRLWRGDQATEAQLAASTARLLQAAAFNAVTKDPPWLKTALAELAEGRVKSTADLARRLDLHPGWLAQSYRAATGEGIAETIRRHRVEQAALLLRNTNLQAAAVAADTGFCDQSHMIRSFKRVLGRTPRGVRNEWKVSAGIDDFGSSVRAALGGKLPLCLHQVSGTDRN